ncbi:uncharacterized protein B0H64DRAFT_419909 [Chaetomium fimeti]|jgi:hypothetical protein|uniref:HD domain-containing protein n=1 Tax=Chaetomium fimeti TaxID=1854472 RepID=A0AAE0HA76_9PEZI|nr:hypothetical protein B0H64DRAFT_419909 [Chaetomium fimeti]
MIISIPLLFLLTTTLHPTTSAALLPSSNRDTTTTPRRLLANVSVIDTPIVRAAQAFARAHSSAYLYNHVMRAWLFGALHLSHNATLAAAVDEEVHAVGLMLHDLGANHSVDSPFFTVDRRFEVDGAYAARGFIQSHPDGRRWAEKRVQLVWDGIALHAEAKFALHKELDVVAIYLGNDLDFGGPRLGITEEEYGAVLAEFPRLENQTEMVLEGISWYCRHKPLSTYDTFMQPYGEMFVPGYSAVGHRGIDRVLARGSY